MTGMTFASNHSPILIMLKRYGVQELYSPQCFVTRNLCQVERDLKSGASYSSMVLIMVFLEDTY